MSFMAKERGRKLIVSNRKARHEYAVEDTFEAGLVLTGTEVKSLRAGRATLSEAFAEISDEEADLVEVREGEAEEDPAPEVPEPKAKKEKKGKKKEDAGAPSAGEAAVRAEATKQLDSRMHGSARCRRRNSHPSMTGIIRSSRMTSG